MALHLPIGPLKPTLGWRRYRDAIALPTRLLADDIATAPSDHRNTESLFPFAYLSHCNGVFP